MLQLNQKKSEQSYVRVGLEDTVLEHQVAFRGLDCRVRNVIYQDAGKLGVASADSARMKFFAPRAPPH